VRAIVAQHTRPALAARATQQAELELGGEDQLPGHRLRRSTHRVVGQRADHAGMHHAAVLQVVRLQRQLGDEPAGTAVDRRDTEVGHERRAGEEGAQRVDVAVHGAHQTVPRALPSWI